MFANDHFRVPGFTFRRVLSLKAYRIPGGKECTSVHGISQMVNHIFQSVKTNLLAATNHCMATSKTLDMQKRMVFQSCCSWSGFHAQNWSDIRSPVVVHTSLTVLVRAVWNFESIPHQVALLSTNVEQSMPGLRKTRDMPVWPYSRA